jgi:cytochrome c peroxidase
MIRYWFLIAIAFVACHPDVPNPEEEALLAIPEGFPAIQFPDDNAFSPARWELGKQLFYDPILSRDQTVSCASCHQAHLAFSDALPVSLGVEQRPGTRNTPSLANVAYHPYFTREGGVPSLEMQILIPIQEHNEFDFNILLIGERLREDSRYRQLSREAYDREPDYFVITRALATFERSLLSGNSPFDQDKLNRPQRRGYELFVSERTGCSSCHNGFDFTNYAFENNGLYENYPDPGRFRLTGDESDRALFKVPSLRNVAVTAPYMHDGSLQNLEAVIEHYNAGGAGHPHQSSLIRPLNLTEKEKADLLAFLASLTDTQFLTNPKFSP